MHDFEANIDPQTNDTPQNLALDWEQVIELSEQMLQTTQAEDWDKLEQIEEERRTLIYASTPPSDAEGRAEVLQVIQKILELDRQVIALCEKGQQALAEKIRSLRIGARARNAYYG